MTRSQRSRLFVVQLLADTSCVVGLWVAVYCIRFQTVFDAPKGTPDFEVYAKLLPFFAVIWVVVAGFSGFYKRCQRIRSAVVEGLDIFYTAALFLGAVVSFTYFYHEFRFSRLLMLIYAGLLPLLMIVSRSLMRKCIRRYRRGKPPHRTLYWGSGLPLEKALRGGRISNWWTEEVIVGVIADSPIEISEGISILKQPSNWLSPDWLRSFDRLVVAHERARYMEIEDTVKELAMQILDIDIYSDIGMYSKLSPSIEIIEGLPVIHVHESPLAGPAAFLKRTFDFIVSLALIVVLSPVLMILAVLVKFSSKGPVFYVQERMGVDGRSFGCLKFRSMPVTAEASTGPVWAKPGENRATGVGSLMRRLSLDELPQLFNVIRGDMSLVGPRPERPVFVEQFRTTIPGYMLRHKVRAGITGWAQVNGWRGDTSLEKRIEFDLYYIQNWSFKFDLIILFRTVNEVFFGKNAY